MSDQLSLPCIPAAPRPHWDLAEPDADIGAVFDLFEAGDALADLLRRVHDAARAGRAVDMSAASVTECLAEWERIRPEWLAILDDDEEGR